MSRGTLCSAFCKLISKEVIAIHKCGGAVTGGWVTGEKLLIINTCPDKSMKKQLEKKKTKQSKKLWEQLQPSVMCRLLGLCFSKQSLCLPRPRLMTHHLAFCNAFRLFSSQSFFYFYFVLIRKSFFCLLLLFVYLLDVAIVWMCIYLREDTKLMSEMKAGCKLDLGILYFFCLLDLLSYVSSNYFSIHWCHNTTQLQQLHYSPLQKVALQQFFFQYFKISSKTNFSVFFWNNFDAASFQWNPYAVVEFTTRKTTGKKHYVRFFFQTYPGSSAFNL